MWIFCHIIVALWCTRVFVHWWWAFCISFCGEPGFWRFFFQRYPVSRGQLVYFLSFAFYSSTPFMVCRYKRRILLMSTLRHQKGRWLVRAPPLLSLSHSTQQIDRLQPSDAVGINQIHACRLSIDPIRKSCHHGRSIRLRGAMPYL